MNSSQCARYWFEERARGGPAIGRDDRAKRSRFNAASAEFSGGSAQRAERFRPGVEGRDVLRHVFARRTESGAGKVTAEVAEGAEKTGEERIQEARIQNAKNQERISDHDSKPGGASMSGGSAIRLEFAERVGGRRGKENGSGSSFRMFSRKSGILAEIFNIRKSGRSPARSRPTYEEEGGRTRRRRIVSERRKWARFGPNNPAQFGECCRRRGSAISVFLKRKEDRRTNRRPRASNKPRASRVESVRDRRQSFGIEQGRVMSQTSRHPAAGAARGAADAGTRLASVGLSRSIARSNS